MNHMNKVRLTEPQLHNVIKESVNKILSELARGRHGSYYDRDTIEIDVEIEMGDEYIHVTLDVDYSAYGDVLDIENVKLSPKNDLEPSKLNYVTSVLDQWADVNEDEIYDKVVDKLSAEADEREGLAWDEADRRGGEMRHHELR